MVRRAARPAAPAARACDAAGPQAQEARPDLRAPQEATRRIPREAQPDAGAPAPVPLQDGPAGRDGRGALHRSEEHTSELQSLMRISYAVLCLKKKNKTKI